ncbi:hypothetical protein V1511DRAFT_466146 [Dipodascopsis uninucleata]
MSRQAGLRAALSSVQKVFPNKGALHKRANLAIDSLDPQFPIKIAIIPFDTERTITKKVMDSLLLLDMPVPYSRVGADDLAWHSFIKKRTLAKDTVVKGALQLVGQVFNAVQVIGLPAPFLTKNNVQLMECATVPESVHEIYEPCHLYLFVSAQISSLTKALPDQELKPSLRILDLPTTEDLSDPNLKLSAMLISTSTAETLLETNENWASESNIAQLRELVLDRDALIKNVVLSILENCKEYIHESEVYIAANSGQSKEQGIVEVRKQWAELAHTELRDVLNPGLESFSRAVTWWKLYFKVDDIENEIAERTLFKSFLPTSERSLLYILGQLSSVDRLQDKMKPSEVVEVQNKMSKLGTSIEAAKEHVRSNLLPTLHSNAQKLIVSTFTLMQLPVFLCAYSGWYFFEFTAYSMTSVTLLGIVMGARQVQKQWDIFVAEFQREVNENAVKAIDEAEVEIFKSWEEKLLTMKSQLSEQQKIVDEISRCSKEM